ncbi:hypothetical protein DFH08DRAFT_1082836 [Mycena albidolilacea]|uniref:Uncharacterized protein n=1 Tax=Mycena albidolilacea TaxID=1033008 RepID=A0AAD7ELT6_9AGAR|nr:hypothetical protein DFH08DRAFT_1082836 [Mycena albidolilacea]
MSVLLLPASSDDVVVLLPADDPLHSDAVRAYVTLSSSSSAVGAVGSSYTLRRTPVHFGITLAAVTIPLVFNFFSSRAMLLCAIQCRKSVLGPQNIGIWSPFVVLLIFS